VAVQMGYGGTNIAGYTVPPSSAASKYQNVNRIIAFKLGGGDVPTPSMLADTPFPKPPDTHGTPAQLTLGEIRFNEQCSRCHVFGTSVTPDLRKLPPAFHNAFKDIVLGGILAPAGMESFSDILSEADVDAIHAYLIDQAWQGYKEQEKSKSPN
jgi:quinohemoprotein ethanol dehydrogenase